VRGLRRVDLLKPPGVAETLDWTEALLALGAERLDEDVATRTLGALLKYREDHERVTSGPGGLAGMLARAGEAAGAG
jgi:hypothetical protein